MLSVLTLRARLNLLTMQSVFREPKPDRVSTENPDGPPVRRRAAVRVGPRAVRTICAAEGTAPPRVHTWGQSMPKKERKRLQVVISEEQDALLTKTAYELSSPERLISKSEVVRLAIEKIAKELGEGEQLDEYRALLEEEDVKDD